jgi:hypothetical protein
LIDLRGLLSGALVISVLVATCALGVLIVGANQLLEQDNPKAMARTRFTTTLFAALKAAITNFKGRARSASHSAGRRRRVMSAPPMCLDFRHSFEGIIPGFASGRK